MSSDDVECLVRAFYREAAQDEVLGPIFAGMGVDWPTHIATLTDFWCGQLFGTRDYVGNPLSAHRPVHDRFPLGTEHYVRWLDLFVGTVDALFVGPTASAAKLRAGKMAHALQRLMDGHAAPGGEAVTVSLGGPRPQR